MERSGKARPYDEVRNSLKFPLEVEGFVIRLYSDGQALLDDAELPRHGCPIFDQDLPGLNGLPALDQLRRRGVLMPAILITSHPSSKPVDFVLVGRQRSVS